MASVVFKLRNYKTSSSSIYYRFNNGRKLDITRKLPFAIDPNKWSKTRQQLICKNNLKLQRNINNQLNNFKAFLLEELALDISNNIEISSNWVKQKQRVFFNPEKEIKKPTHILFSDYLQQFTDIKKIDSYKFTALKRWAIKTGNPRLEDVNYYWIEKLIELKLSEGFAESTINKDVQHIKRILKYAELNEIKINRNAFEIKAPTPNSISTYLNENELDLIFKYKCKTKRLENVKRLFLVGCTTGLRISDLMKVQNYRNNENYIEITTQKTKQSLAIPIEPRVKEYIPTLRGLSHPVFNRYLKELCQLAKINSMTKGYIKDPKTKKRILGTYPKYKLISSHTMRRSFASNLYGKLPTVVIMAVTGHNTEKSFLTYIKKPQRHFAEELRDFYIN